MLERLAGNDALKAELGTALRGGRLPHAVLLVGEPGCGAGFAARCLAADVGLYVHQNMMKLKIIIQHCS